MSARAQVASSSNPGDGGIVIIPTYNEAENLRVLLPRLLALDPDLSILVVDDNSPDGTGRIADEFAVAHPGRVQVLDRACKKGIGPAYRAGIQRALDGNYRFIATMDADLSHDPADLPRLVSALEDADVVIGSRNCPGGGSVGWPAYRQMLSRFGSWYARTILGVDVADLTGGFKVYRPTALRSLTPDTITGDGYVFQIETTYRLLRQGCRVTEVPIVFVDRQAGSSKLSRRIVAEAIIVVWKLRFDKSGGDA